MLRLKAGGTANVALWSDPAASATGRIREIAGAADAQSRTYRVRVAIDNPPPAMRLGMTAVVKIGLGTGGSAISVPITALVPQGNGFAVFVAGATSHTVRLVPVTTGAAGGYRRARHRH